MSSAGDSNKMIVLKSSEGELFEVEESVAMQSQTIKNMIEDNCVDGGIPLPIVSSHTLTKVIEYCRRHVEAAASEDKSVIEELAKFDVDFVKVDKALLFDLVSAANYLNIKGLLDLTCKTVADMITGKTPEEIRTIFGITNDFTSEEEDEIRKEYAWAFE